MEVDQEIDDVGTYQGLMSLPPISKFSDALKGEGWTDDRVENALTALQQAGIGIVEVTTDAS